MITNCWLRITLGVLLLTVSPGCRLLTKTVEAPVRAVSPGSKEKKRVDPVDIQQKLLRFTDQFSSRMVGGADQLRRGTNEIDPADVLRWKISICTETCSIASGPNAVADLLDMTVLVSVMRDGLEGHWLPQVYGESARPMLDSCRNSETEIWKLASEVINTNQQAELRLAIVQWQTQNPVREGLVGARALGFASRIKDASKSDTTQPASVFNLLMIDPLSGLDPATREIAETRLFAERALYVTQFMPTLLRWQTELLSLNAVAMPEVRQLVANSTQIAASVERFAALAEKLPGQVSAEREAIVKDLQSQEKNLTPLVDEVRQTLNAGTQMSASLNTTLKTFDSLMQRFGVGETNSASPPDTNSAPFNILDYAQTATRVEAMAKQLTELIVTLDGTVSSTNLDKLTAQVSPAVQKAQIGSKEIVDYAVWRGILLIAIALAAALIYRFVSVRLTSAARSKSDSP